MRAPLISSSKQLLPRQSKKKRVSETSLCYWNGDASGVSPKSVAVCSIEDDGGRLVIVSENVQIHWRPHDLRSLCWIWMDMMVFASRKMHLLETSPMSRTQYLFS
jgi:hypothetical protein